MWADARLATGWGLIWLLATLAAFLALPKPGTAAPNERHSVWWSWPAILLVALAVRLIPALLLPVGAGYDIESFRLVTDALLGGREVYTAAAGRHPYLPMQMYVLGASAALSAATGLAYPAAVKLPAVLADAGIAMLIYHALRREGRHPEAAGYLAMLYALNPISILVTAYHGQFESVTLLLLASAWYFWRFGRRRASAVAAGFAVLNKTWPVIFLPIVLIRLRSWRERLIFGAIAVAVPVLFTLAYLLVFSADPTPMLRRALTHRGVPGYWGPGAVLAMLGRDVPLSQAVFEALAATRNWLLAAAILLALWLTRRQPALDALLTTILAMFVVTVGFGIQWLVWPVPFALLAGEESWSRRYGVAGSLMLVVHLYALHMYPWLGPLPLADPAEWLVRLSALPAWIVAVWWAAQRLRRARTAETQLSPSAV